jgi:hypothetical protein
MFNSALWYAEADFTCKGPHFFFVVTLFLRNPIPVKESKKFGSSLERKTSE